MSAPIARSVAEHAAVVAELIGPTVTATVPLCGSRGSVTASTIVAGTRLPRFDNSAVDGFAVAAGGRRLTVDERQEFELVGQINAEPGEYPRLVAGLALRIMTGAPVPDGVDAVVAQEHVTRDGDRIRIAGGIAPSLNIRAAGEEVPDGAVIARRGAVMTAGLAGLCAALGINTVEVYAKLRVAILSTGSELVEGSAGSPRHELRPGEILASNAIMLTHAVAECGATVVHTATVSDDPEDFLDAMTRAGALADVVITSGGIGFGDHDVVKSSLRDRGVDLCIVNMRPGRPQGAGRFEGVAVVTLPGNPLAALASFEAFIRPALRTAMGFSGDGRPTLRAQLNHTIDTRPGTVRFILGAVANAPSGSVPVVDLTTTGRGLSAVIGANCFTFLDTDRPRLAAGDLVTVTVEGGAPGDLAR
ncbi:molybdopterin molybdotransferase MoeA [Williamsia maris]|uniref:Molybdopterin molybdenumtransferase n=1 Tax=Williamsia maris TaxID=72806 RepID=A0ABT1HJE8_9NOCA|nr:molybdopterin molybdotransferase [Williamsia maris]